MDRTASVGCLVAAALFVLCGLSGSSTGQTPSPSGKTSAPATKNGAGMRARIEQRANKDYSDLLVAGGFKPRELMLLGSFHFKDAGLDAHKPKHSFDALSEARQKEIEEVVDALAKFNPARICLEQPYRNQADLDKSYQAYLKGERNDRPNEIYQIRMRLAKRLGHKGVYAVDTDGRWYEPRVDIAKFAKEHKQEAFTVSPLEQTYGKYLDRMDRMVDESPLRETLLYMNAPILCTAGLGPYLLGSFHVGEGDQYPGIDGFVSSWFNRNLKIFENVARGSQPGERVLLLIGAGHVPIIRQAVQASPEFKLVEVADYLAVD